MDLVSEHLILRQNIRVVCVFSSLSRSSAGRERSEKPLSSAPSRPGSFVRGVSAKELLASPALSPEEPRREQESIRRLSISEDKTEPECSRAREPGKATKPSSRDIQ